VVLLVRLDRRGELEGLSVLRSSGSDILDRAAVRLMRGVMPYDHGAGRPIHLEVPITYRLTDG
jgi:TonB family protein